MAFREINIKYFIILLLASILWGTSYPVITVGLSYSSPDQLLFLRFSLAFIIGILFFPRTIIRIIKNRDLLLVGVFNGLAYLMQFIGQETVPPGQTSILINSYTLFVPIFAFILINEDITLKKIISISLGLIGVILIINIQDLNQTNEFIDYIVGIIIILFAGVTWALYAVYSKKIQINNANLRNKIRNEDIYIATVFYTSIISFISLLLTQPKEIIVTNLEFLTSSIYLSIFCTFLAFVLYLKALEQMDTTVVSVTLLLQVIVAYLIAIIFLKETITIIQILGIVFIIGGVILISQREKNDNQIDII